MSRICRYMMGIALLASLGTCARSQEVLDQIAARVEHDIILLSEVRTLSRYQLLVDGKSESDSAILDRLVDQWIVRNEADTARFPHPSDVDIARGLDRLLAAFDSLDEYQARKKAVGLSDSDVQKMIADQLYLSNYLDSRFRPVVQVSPAEI